MIQVNELRIGNLFQDEDSTFCYFAGAWQRADGWIIRDSGNNTYKEAQVYPIPLSPELLQACGLHSQFTPSFETDDGDLTGMVQYWYKDSFIFIPEKWPHIKDLHQLQNLYFALTGSELSVNLEKVKA